MVISFFVPGIPATAGSKTPFIYKSKKDGKQRVSMTPANKKQKPWMSHVREVAVENYKKPPIVEAIRVLITFYLPRPKNHFGTGKNKDVVKKSSPIFPQSKPDLFKLVRAVEDALTGIVYKDDSQIFDVKATKLYCNVMNPTPGVEISIRE